MLCKPVCLRGACERIEATRENAAAKTIGPDMLRIAPDYLSTICDGQLEVALVVICTRPSEVGIGELRTGTDGLAEALNSPVVLLILQVSDTPLQRFDGLRIALFAGQALPMLHVHRFLLLLSGKPQLPGLLITLAQFPAYEKGGLVNLLETG